MPGAQCKPINTLRLPIIQLYNAISHIHTHIKIQARKVTQHRRSTRLTRFHANQVYVKNHRGGVPWLLGVIVQATGTVSYRVEMADGNIICSHQDQIRRQFTKALQPSKDKDDLLSQISEDPSLADTDVPPPGTDRHDAEAAYPTPTLGPPPPLGLIQS